MRQSKSEYASTKYPNLYRYPTSPCWIFRKYSSEKRKEFIKSTGISDDQSKAYRTGLEKFNKWMGIRLHHSGREILIRDLGRAILEAKKSKRDNTYRSSRNQIENHIMPALGHLRPEQITPLKWDQYDADERAKGKRTKLFNTRKALIEILNRSKDEGIIQSVPKLINHDGEAREGKYLDEITVKSLIVGASSTTSLLLEILYLMGPRPGEAIQYEFGMIRWDEGPTGKIYIPGRITKTGRSRAIPLNSRVSALLWFRQHEIGGKFVFPSPTNPGRSVKEYKTGWDTACRRAGIKKEDDIIPYDLRCTWITNQATRGISQGFTAKYSDTSPEMIHKIYLRAVGDSMQEAAG